MQLLSTQAVTHFQIGLLVVVFLTENPTIFINLFFAAMLLASDAFGDAVREVYEPDWPGRDKLIQHLEVCDQ